jgi:hypothetical protein
MNIDEYDFENTAKAVFVMNDSCKERYESWEDLRSFMIGMAYQYGGHTHSFSTGGFQLSFFNGSDGEIHCRASVSAYVALKYVESVTKGLTQ